MNKIFAIILRFILNFQQQRHAKKMASFELPKSSLSFSNGSSKTYMNAHESIVLSSKLDEKKSALDKTIREIVKKNVKTPEHLLDFIQKNGTKVYRLKFADKLLRFIGEDEGFILPLKGLEALCLNLILERKIAFKTPEMFVLRDLPVNIYIMSHQFYKWFGFKKNMPGFDERAVELFRSLGEFEGSLGCERIKNLKYADIMSLKEALRRDIEAIDFVVSLSRESEGAKTAFGNIEKGAGANV